MTIFRLLLIGLATASTILVIVGIAKSDTYAPLVEMLDAGQYPLKSLYGLGFYLASLPLFAQRDASERELKRVSKLYWNNIYYVYYAELAWAQFLTFASLLATVGLSMATIVPGEASIVFLLIVVIGIAALWNQFVSHMGDAVKQRRDECEYAFPDMVVKFALLVSSGMVSRLAWRTVAYSKEGPLYDLMQRACDEMDNGMTETEAIHRLGVLTDSDMIKKFTSSLTQSMEKGGSDLSAFLLGQTSELLAHKRQTALQRGEAAATKLIIPISLMFVGVVIIIIVGAAQSLMGAF